MSETSSQRDMSETSSQQSDAKQLKKRKQASENNSEENDLLEQKKNLQEAVFLSMYTLSKGKPADPLWYAGLKILLEGLCAFLICFNRSLLWHIEYNLWIWKIVRWALPRVPVSALYGYGMFAPLVYIIVVTIYVTLAAIALLTVLMRKQETSKWTMRFARVLQVLVDIIFSVAYMAIFDFLAQAFNCHYGGTNMHNYFKNVQCFSMPHLAMLAVAGVTAAVFMAATACMIVAASDLNPVAAGLLASPVARMRLRILVLKAFFIIVSNCLGVVPKLQSVLMVLAAWLVFFYNLTESPFLHEAVNHIWTAEWAAIVYTNILYAVLCWSKDRHDPVNARKLTLDVLYGIFPIMLGGAAASYFWLHRRMRRAKLFENLPPNTKLAKVYKFPSLAEVEVLARVMRHFDKDGMVLPQSADLGETILKAGLACYPGNPRPMINYANFLMSVRLDGPGSRTQLQIALKANPDIISRYQIFATAETSKRLKGGSEGQLDLQSYVEFKRNYRAVLRVHKEALSAQRDLWSLLQRANVTASSMQASMRTMQDTAATAHQVYKRVLERYPSNGKLLRCYGSFLEFVMDDPAAAARAYQESARNGGSDVLSSLDLSIDPDGKPDFLTSMDLNEDTVIVINAEGIIMMANACVAQLFGWTRSELEGLNISTLVPQPFASRHNSYMQRYTTTMQPHIIDRVREVVALHKQRYVFPVQLCVTRLSGTGADCIFLGVVRPMPLDIANVRVWVAPTGAILCTDQAFAGICGAMPEAVVGKMMQDLVLPGSLGALEALLSAAASASEVDMAAGAVAGTISIKHRYLAPVEVNVVVRMGGTESQRLYMFCLQRSASTADGLIVMDTRGNLRFATWDVAAALGYSLREFLELKLESLMPQPYAALHRKYIKDPPMKVAAGGCRAGHVVHLLSATGAPVPVRLKLSTADEGGSTLHVMQVTRVNAGEEELHGKRVVLTVSLDGTITGLATPPAAAAALFGLLPTADSHNHHSGSHAHGDVDGKSGPKTADVSNAVADVQQLVGKNLCEFVDVFEQWRAMVAVAHNIGGGVDGTTGTQQTSLMLQLMMLSLLDKEAEMPGSAWRVGVKPAAAAAADDAHDAAGHGAGGKLALLLGNKEGGDKKATDRRPAFMHVEVDEKAMAEGTAGDTLAVRVTLWRSEMVGGVMELDPATLQLRKADAQAGLLLGRPAAALARARLHKLLKGVQSGTSWSALVADPAHRMGGKGAHHHLKPSALKAGAAPAISPPLSFTVDRPDGGTMNISIQVMYVM